MNGLLSVALALSFAGHLPADDGGCILDSDRTDVDYEDYRGHKLDRELLELLRRY